MNREQLHVLTDRASKIVTIEGRAYELLEAAGSAEIALLAEYRASDVIKPSRAACKYLAECVKSVDGQPYSFDACYAERGFVRGRIALEVYRLSFGDSYALPDPCGKCGKQLGMISVDAIAPIAPMPADVPVLVAGVGRVVFAVDDGAITDDIARGKIDELSRRVVSIDDVPVQGMGSAWRLAIRKKLRGALDAFDGDAGISPVVVCGHCGAKQKVHLMNDPGFFGLSQ